MPFFIKILFVSTLSFTADKFFAQINNSFTFIDQYKNQISLQDWQKYPGKLDTALLKKNLDGLDFFPKLLESDKRYNITILKISSVRTDRKYMLEIVTTPKKGSIEDILSNQGHRFYLLKTTPVNNRKLKIDTIAFAHSEI